MAGNEQARKVYEARLAEARADWQRHVDAARGGEVNLVKPPEPPDLEAIKDDDIKDAYEIENYGDAELTRRVLAGRWLRDVKTIKDGEFGEGGDFYEWDGSYWAPDIYSTLMDELRPLYGLFMRLAAVPAGRLAETRKQYNEAKAELKKLRLAKANRDEAKIQELQAETFELKNQLDEQRASIKPIERRAKAVCLRPRLKNIIHMAFSCKELQADGEHWNRIEYLLPLMNGTMDLRTGKLVEPRPEHLFNRRIPWKFEGFDKPCDFFKQMVKQCMCGDGALYEYFMDSLATCLIGKQEKNLYLWLGPKANNGKSTLDGLLKRLLGVEGGFCCDLNVANYLYTGLKDSERPAAGILQLVGARLAISGEPGAQDYFDLGKVKKLTSAGDTINARTLNSAKMRSFPQTQTGIIHCNAIPRCNGSDAGLRSRMRAIPFRAQFLRDEELPGGQPDEANHIYRAIDKTEIDARLDGEMTGILAELIKRAMKIYAGARAPVPEEVMEAGKNYTIENDLALQYLDERTREAPGAAIQAATLYEDFRAWCVYVGGLSNSKVPTRTKFGKMLAPHVPKEKRPEGLFYTGLEFKPGQPTPKELKTMAEGGGEATDWRPYE